MKMYFILMRGNQENFNHLSDEDRKVIVQAHMDYASGLVAKGVFVEGDGFHTNSLLLSMVAKGQPVKVESSPYSNTDDQLSGFYLIKVETEDEALEIARACPALLQGETIELIALGH